MKWLDAKVAITHRVGRLEIMDIAVVITVSSPHRKVTYEANEYAIERIKRIVPIWKKFWEDGTMWVERSTWPHLIQKKTKKEE